MSHQGESDLKKESTGKSTEQGQNIHESKLILYSPVCATCVWKVRKMQLSFWLRRSSEVTFSVLLDMVQCQEM